MSDDQSLLLPASRLERLIGKPSSEWTVDDLVAVFVGERLRLVNLMHVGGDGWLKTLDFVPRDRVHLRDVLTSGERADGSSLFGMLGVAVTASDVVVRPRPSSAFLDPFASAPALAVLCDHAGRDGQPLRSRPTPSSRGRRRGSRPRPACNCTRSARSSTSSASDPRRATSTARPNGATTRVRRSSSARPCGARRWSAWPRWACP